MVLLLLMGPYTVTCILHAIKCPVDTCNAMCSKIPELSANAAQYALPTGDTADPLANSMLAQVACASATLAPKCRNAQKDLQTDSCSFAAFHVSTMPARTQQPCTANALSYVHAMAAFGCGLPRNHVSAIAHPRFPLVPPLSRAQVQNAWASSHCTVKCTMQQL